jgi:hypothetical protein
MQKFYEIIGLLNFFTTVLSFWFIIMIIRELKK